MFLLLFALIFTFSVNTSVSAYPRALADVVTTCTKANQVAITFDDGPYDYEYDIVDTLNKNGAKGTFFVNGYNWRCIYDDESVKRIQYLLNSGHQVASHTWSHPHLPELDYDQILAELGSINTALEKTVGRVPKFLRPPYGEYNDDVVSAASSLGQTVVIWSDDSGDSLNLSLDEQKQVYDEFVSRKSEAGIFLNHEVESMTAYQLLPHAIEKLKGAGYQLVTLAECLGESPYLYQTKPSSPDDSWTCDSL